MLLNCKIGHAVTCRHSQCMTGKASQQVCTATKYCQKTHAQSSQCITICVCIGKRIGGCTSNTRAVNPALLSQPVPRISTCCTAPLSKPRRLQSIRVSTLLYLRRRDCRAAVATASNKPADCKSRSRIETYAKPLGLSSKQILTRSVPAERATVGCLERWDPPYRFKLGNCCKARDRKCLLLTCAGLKAQWVTGQQLQVACIRPGPRVVNDVTAIAPPDPLGQFYLDITEWCEQVQQQRWPELRTSDLTVAFCLTYRLGLDE